MSQEYTQFGIWCKQKMVALGIKNIDIAKHLDISERYVSDVFRGRKRGLKYLDPIVEYIYEIEACELKKDSQLREVV